MAFTGPAASAPTEDEDRTPNTTRETDRDEDEDATDEETAETTDEAPAVVTLPVGDGKVNVGDVAAGTSVALTNVTYPVKEGWVGVRSYQDGRLGSILGVVRFSESQGLVPPAIVLQAPMRAGAQYAIVMFTEDGDRQFNLAVDTQIDEIFATFTAK